MMKYVKIVAIFLKDRTIKCEKMLFGFKFTLRSGGTMHLLENLKCAYFFMKNYIFNIESLVESFQKLITIFMMHLTFIKKDKLGVKIQIGAEDRGYHLRFRTKQHLFIFATSITITIISVLESLPLLIILFSPLCFLFTTFILPILGIATLVTVAFYKIAKLLES